MACWYLPRLNRLSSICYCVAVLSIQVYLLYIGLVRYAIYTDTKWPPDQEPNHRYMLTYVTLHGLIIALIPLFVTSAVFKVGNLASDGEQLSSRHSHVIRTTKHVICRKLKALWTHAVPVAQTMHLAMASAFLISNALVESELYKYDKLFSTDELWNSEVDFVYRSREKLLQLLPTPSPLNLSNMLQHFTPKLLPIVLTTKFFGLSLPFINYVIALAAFSVAYPSVFWKVSRAFGFVFSCYLIVHMEVAISSFVAFCLVHRIQVSSRLEHFTRPSAFLLQEPFLVIVYLITATVLVLSSTVVYGYGYNKYCQTVLVNHGKSMTQRKVLNIYCEGYSSHIAAIITLIMVGLCKAPILYDLMVLYQHDPHAVLLYCIVSDVLYLFVWIVLWLVLTLKRQWKFNIFHKAEDIGTMLDILTIEGRKCDKDTVIVMCNDMAFATSDERKRSAILHVVESCGLGKKPNGLCWLQVPEALAKAPRTGAETYVESRLVSTDYEAGFSSTTITRQSNNYAETDPRLVPQTLMTPIGPAQSIATLSRFGRSSRFPEEASQQQPRETLSTFGTLPRNDDSQKHIPKDHEYGNFHDKHYSTLSPLEKTTYASIHRPKHGRITHNTSKESELTKLMPENSQENTQSISRGSSYVNVASSTSPTNEASFPILRENRAYVGRTSRYYQYTHYHPPYRGRNTSYSSLQNASLGSTYPKSPSPVCSDTIGEYTGSPLCESHGAERTKSASKVSFAPIVTSRAQRCVNGDGQKSVPETLQQIKMRSADQTTSNQVRVDWNVNPTYEHGQAISRQHFATIPSSAAAAVVCAGMTRDDRNCKPTTSAAADHSDSAALALTSSNDSDNQFTTSIV